jgi:hypothetical protein
MESTTTKTETLFLNGIDGTTGGYLQPALTPAELVRLARREAPETRHLGKRRSKGQPIPQGLKEGLDPRRLEEAGWGVVFTEDADPLIREALEPLLQHRRRQAGRFRPGRYRELTGRDGYRPGESKLRFLARHGVGSGPVDPDRLPYYLTLVGEPEAIPYTFQYQLDVQYAVGRVCFDTPEEYARYAEAVVAAESGAYPRPRRATFFSVRNDGDPATEMCHDLLVTPLARQLARETRGWEIATARGPEATRERLGRLLGGGETPALLFTASHGVGFRQPHPEQRRLQGALACQEWRGPGGSARDGTSPYFTADDLSEGACPGGLVAFVFACFGAGTPRRNDFAHRGDGEPAEVAERPFVARLPQKLLSHPRGGALAVVGHVDRAWSYSFDWPLAGAQREVFASTLKRLMAGHPVGSAMEYFNQRYAELECDLAELRSTLGLGGAPDLIDEAGLWTARNDARNFLVVGDPAVRLTPRDENRGGEAA